MKFEEHDLFKLAPTETQLRALFGERDIEEFISRRSGAFAELGYGSKIPPRSQVLKDMCREVNLIRRPLLFGPRGVAVIGFDRARYEDLFGAA